MDTDNTGTFWEGSSTSMKWDAYSVFVLKYCPSSYPSVNHPLKNKLMGCWLSLFRQRAVWWQSKVAWTLLMEMCDIGSLKWWCWNWGVTAAEAKKKKASNAFVFYVFADTMHEVTGVKKTRGMKISQWRGKTTT